MSFFGFNSHAAASKPADGPSPDAVLAFWREAGPARWFTTSSDFDNDFRRRFMTAHEAAVQGLLMRWMGHADSALALILLLDQFPRNCFRGTPRMYATDAQALLLAQKALGAGYDTLVEADLRVFFYLPLMHDEHLNSQERCVALCASIGGIALKSAHEHYDIIQRFGRFPHRNTILGRPTRPEEQRFLDAGGFSG